MATSIPYFDTLETLAASLDAANLGEIKQAVLATARPVLRLLRHGEPDDDLAAGVSKFGGLPDLPPDFVWPMREPVEEGFAKSLAVLRRGESTARDLESMPRTPPLPPLDPRVFRQIRDSAQEEAMALLRPAPLAFVAQFDLAELSSEAGFADEFPRTGLLSLFADATQGGFDLEPRAFWFDTAPSGLSRRPVPPELIEHCEKVHPSDAGQAPWAERKMAGRFYPVSGVCVPYHWTHAFADDGDLARRVNDWFERPKFAAGPLNPLREWDKRVSVDFGDRFGGWPDPIQGDPETEMPGAPRQILQPGDTPWRLIFSFGGETDGETRIVTPAFETDGTTYFMIRADDLAARRFDRIGATLQFD